jgi:uncharacterized protein YbcI
VTLADPEKVRHDIAEELLKVHHEAYGTGASEVQVHVADDLVVIVLDIELNPAERTLIDADRSDAVKDVRESFQQAIAPTFSAIVERATGRRVAGFLSSMSVDPLFAVEIFRLEPH